MKNIHSLAFGILLKSSVCFLIHEYLVSLKKLVLVYRQYFANNRYIKNRLVYATIMYWWVYVCEVLSVFKHVILWFQTMSIESYYNKTCLGTRLFVVLYTYWNRFITPRVDLHRVWACEISKIFWVFTSIKTASKGCT